MAVVKWEDINDSVINKRWNYVLKKENERRKEARGKGMWKNCSSAGRLGFGHKNCSTREKTEKLTACGEDCSHWLLFRCRPRERQRHNSFRCQSQFQSRTSRPCLMLRFISLDHEKKHQRSQFFSVRLVRKFGRANVRLSNVQLAAKLVQ